MLLNSNMLIVNDDCFKSDNIIKISSDSDWDADDSGLLTNCAMDSLTSLLRQSPQTNSTVLIIDCEKGTLPTVKIGIEIAKKFINIKSLIGKTVDFTIVYAKNEATKQWVNNILQIYTPSRGLHIIDRKSNIKKLLKITKEHKGIENCINNTEVLSILNNTVSVQN